MSGLPNKIFLLVFDRIFKARRSFSAGPILTGLQVFVPKVPLVLSQRLGQNFFLLGRGVVGDEEISDLAFWQVGVFGVFKHQRQSGVSYLVSSPVGSVGQRQTVFQSKKLAELVGKNLNKTFGHLKASPVNYVSHSGLKMGGASHTTDRSQLAPLHS